MSLIVAAKGRDGLVIASDSRRMVELDADAYAIADDAMKLHAFPEHRIAAAVGGSMQLHHLADLWRTVGGELFADRPCVKTFARRLGGLFTYRVPVVEYVPLVVAGLDAESTPRLFTVDVHQPTREQPFPAVTPVEQHPGGYGLTWVGQREFVDRLLQGWDSRLSEVLDGVEGLEGVQAPLALAALSLAELVRLTTFLVRMTAEVQSFISGRRCVGGPIDVLTITPQEGLRWVQRKAASVDTLTREGVGATAPAITDTPSDGLRPASYTIPQR